MIIIIDGYNFLKSITGAKFITDHQMQTWIGQFETYQKKRKNRVLIVLDAGPSFYPSCEKIRSIEICYSGQHQTADDWIKVWLDKNKQKDVLLVSSDREIRAWAHQVGVVSISSQDFYKIFKEVLQEHEIIEQASDLTLYKTKEYESSDFYLDALMESASLDLSLIASKEDDKDQDFLRSNKKVSKSDKSLLKKIDKI